ncbi:hypothetical protein G6F59_018136 [Rhizopus arrhizus]|nr:hypothetical protein G6F59_018136 [Rhizopus arrhizus]
MSPSRAWIRPLLRTSPAVLPATKRGAISLPPVVDDVFCAVPTPRRITKLSPAASWVWPLRVSIWPAFSTLRPANRT